MTNYKTDNFTFRTYELYVDAIKRAAERAGKSPSEYVRDVVIPWAFSDLGERMPQLPRIERGRYSNTITQAAKQVGKTRRQFEQDAAIEAATRTLFAHVELTEVGKGSVSGFRRKQA